MCQRLLSRSEWHRCQNKTLFATTNRPFFHIPKSATKAICLLIEWTKIEPLTEAWLTRQSGKQKYGEKLTKWGIKCWRNSWKLEKKNYESHKRHLRSELWSHWKHLDNFMWGFGLWIDHRWIPLHAWIFSLFL